MAQEIYLDVFIIDNYEEPQIQIARKEAPRETQAELRAFF